jgi:adenosylcobinamide kinase / adenosylcobinamide-phosphate guanylyltransferase
MAITRTAELVFVLGGARSGKSSWALRYTEEHYRSYLYLATAEVRDEEMAERVRWHQASRGPQWNLLEEPLEISETLISKCTSAEAVLVDCLTIWLSNVMLNKGEDDIVPYQEHLLDVLSLRRRAIILVANEVGGGVVPDSALGRKFRDHAGLLNQKIAALADKVIFMIAGLPWFIKGEQ